MNTRMPNHPFKIIKPIALAPILLALAIAGCSSHTPEKPQTTAEYPVIEPQKGKRPKISGNYSSSRVSGDFVGYRELDEFIARMESNHGFSRDYLEGVFSQAQRRQSILDLMNRQSGSSTSTPSPGAWSRYRSKFVDETHVQAGAAFWQRHAQALQKASDRYGIPPEYVLGIMGVETIYGRNVGNIRVFDALTTLAFDYPRRSQYFTEELENYLLMTRDEGMDPLDLKGSYAGAMGLGQFMPGSFLKWAVDLNGDGKRDLWDPEDAIGSIANYFSQHGWQPGGPVATPAEAQGPVYLTTGYDQFYTPDQLAAQGLTPVAPISGQDRVSLLLLRGANGDEYWLGHNNFYVITRYNHSTHYAMAVHDLAQAIKQRYLGGMARSY